MLSEHGRTTSVITADRAPHQVGAVLVVGVAAVVAAAVTGGLVGFGATHWLAYGLGVSLVLWVGGAVSGQVLLARLLDRGTDDQVLTCLRQLLWIIPRFYVPVGFVAVGCGLGLVVRSGTSLGEPAVAVPLALYGLTAVAGSAISAPGYLRLIRLAEADGSTDPRVRRRLLHLAWLNRVELALVLGVGFPLLAGMA